MRLILAILTAVPLLAQALDHRVAHFDSSGVSIEDALKQLVGSPGRTFVIGFEQAVDAGLNEPTIKLQIDRATAGEVLRAICSQDPRYTFSEMQPGVVDVYPIGENPEARAILNLPLRRVDISVRDWPRNIFARIANFAPDLNAYLTARAERVPETYALAASRFSRRDDDDQRDASPHRNSPPANHCARRSECDGCVHVDAGFLPGDSKGRNPGTPMLEIFVPARCRGGQRTGRLSALEHLLKTN
jgi:hypothetical protein